MTALDLAELIAQFQSKTKVKLRIYEIEIDGSCDSEPEIIPILHQTETPETPVETPSEPIVKNVTPEPTKTEQPKEPPAGTDLWPNAKRNNVCLPLYELVRGNRHPVHWRTATDHIWEDPKSIKDLRDVVRNVNSKLEPHRMELVLAKNGMDDDSYFLKLSNL